MQEPTRVDFSNNPMAEPDFKFYDKSLLDDVKRGDPNVHEFFRLLALCHTVMPEYKEGKYKVLLTRSYWLLSLGNLDFTIRVCWMIFLKFLPYNWTQLGIKYGAVNPISVDYSLFNLGNRVVNLGSNTYGNPIFQN